MKEATSILKSAEVLLDDVENRYGPNNGRSFIDQVILDCNYGGHVRAVQKAKIDRVVESSYVTGLASALIYGVSAAQFAIFRDKARGFLPYDGDPNRIRQAERTLEAR